MIEMLIALSVVIVFVGVVMLMDYRQSHQKHVH